MATATATTIVELIVAAMTKTTGRKRVVKTGKPFFRISRLVPADATYNGTPDKNAGKIIIRGVCQLGNGGKGSWFKTCTLKDDNTIKNAQRGAFVPEDKFGDWSII